MACVEQEGAAAELNPKPITGAVLAGLGNSWCECPSSIASTPGTCARYQFAFSICGEYGLSSRPPCEIATTMSAPFLRISGMYFLAASTTPVV